MDGFFYSNGGMRATYIVGGYFFIDLFLLIFLCEDIVFILVGFVFYNGDVFDEKMLFYCVIIVLDK